MLLPSRPTSGLATVVKVRFSDTASTKIMASSERVFFDKISTAQLFNKTSQRFMEPENSIPELEQTILCLPSYSFVNH
jgi:sulfur transfer protein SufE